MDDILTIILALGLIAGGLFMAEYEIDRQETMRKAAESARQTEYVQLNPQMDADLQEAILAGQIIIGMTTDQVRASRGKPGSINRSIGRWGVHEQWVYYYTTSSVWFPIEYQLYLYFENGRLTSWQD